MILKQQSDRMNHALWIITAAVFISAVVSCSNKKTEAEGHDKPVTVTTNYHPLYWVEGPAERIQGDMTEAVADSICREVYEKGWRGIMYWGADRNGEQIRYYFRSPFLEKQDWAVFEKDGLTPLARAAHQAGLKVMVNIEGINPYHWQQNKWTPENIQGVAEDLAADSADAVFEECFEVKPQVFISLARTLKSKGVNYISGTDPMLFREANFTTLWPETGTIDIYNYYLKRDKIFNIATLAEHGTLGFGWARYWGKPTALISPVNRNWGIQGDYSPAVIRDLCMIRALQFRLDNFIIFGGMNTFDPVETQAWINEYVSKQEKDRPLADIVVLLRKQVDGNNGDAGWNRLFNSGDAVTSGILNAGYNLIVSDKVVPADAYWIYASGEDADLPPDVVDLFSSGKPVFLQCGGTIPSGPSLRPGWKAALEKCGVDASRSFASYAEGKRGSEEESFSTEKEIEIPYTGYYKDIYLRFTGTDVQRGSDLRTGTVIPVEAISGTVFCAPNKTYGRGPYIVGRDNKYVVTATCLNWEAAYPISDLLANCGILPSSNVWGIAGKNVTALLAIETTELNLKIPDLEDGSRIQVVVWDKKGNRKSDELQVYNAPFKRILMEYDFVLISKAD